VWLPWKAAGLLSAALVVIALAVRPRRATGASRRRWSTIVAGVAGEAAVMAGLYAVWQLAGTVSVMQTDGALVRARSIWDVERWLHLPSEVTLQHLVLPHPWLVQALNQFYAIAHGTAMLVFLIWLFARHRDHYPRTRNIIAVVTGASLAIQLVPVAPPRMLPSLGFVDTALEYDQSVYAALGRGLAYQLSAMPSVHVAWAVLIALVVMQVSSSRWRWLVLAHPVVTVWAVVVTANHFWLDGVVAVALIPLAALAVTVVSAIGDRLRGGRGTGRPPDGAEPSTALEPASDPTGEERSARVPVGN